jgi:hypothetical protein
MRPQRVGPVSDENDDIVRPGRHELGELDVDERPPAQRQHGLRHVGIRQVCDPCAEPTGEHGDRARHPEMTVVLPW